MQKRALTLSTTKNEPRCVSIDGTDYPLLWPDALTILGMHQVSHAGQRIKTIHESAEERTEADASELSAAAATIVRVVLQAPDDVVAKLTDIHKFLIAKAFLEDVSTYAPDAVEPVTTAAAVPEGGAL